jgi:para-nitrobenzyl esterase
MAKPVEILGHMRVSGGLDMRVQTVTQAARKSVQPAPVYAYSFAWRTPVLDGRLRAFHRSELPFFFDNTDRCAHMTGGTAAARSLAAKVSGALIQFARTGSPNHSGLPHWPAFSVDKTPTMVFDDRCEVKFDHDRAAREAYERAAKPMS